MTLQDFEQLVEDQCDHMLVVLDAKGKDYRGDEDALANFKAVGFRNGLTPWKVWGVYFGKHIMAIERFVSIGQLESEPIEERITDAQNYLMLLLGLVREKKQEQELAAASNAASPPASDATGKGKGDKLLAILGLRR